MARSCSYAFTGQAELTDGILRHQTALYAFLVEKLAPLDRRLNSTLQNVVASLLASNFEQKKISDKLGVSRTTINRWANGNNIPKSAGYREWLVTTLIDLLQGSIPDDRIVLLPGSGGDLARPSGKQAETKKPGRPPRRSLPRKSAMRSG